MAWFQVVGKLKTITKQNTSKLTISSMKRKSERNVLGQCKIFVETDVHSKVHKFLYNNEFPTLVTVLVSSNNAPDLPNL
jgi:hypothetical protein